MFSLQNTEKKVYRKNLLLLRKPIGNFNRETKFKRLQTTRNTFTIHNFNANGVDAKKPKHFTENTLYVHWASFAYIWPVKNCALL